MAEVDVELRVGGFDSLSQHRQYNLSVLLGREEPVGRKCDREGFAFQVFES